MKKRLGEVLLDKRLIDVDQLTTALGHQRQWGVRLGVSLVALGFIAEGTMVQALADALGMPMVDLAKVAVDKAALSLVPERVCVQSEVFPIAVRALSGGRSTLLLAMADPLNTAAIDEVAFISDCIVKPSIAPTSNIEQAINRHIRGRRVEIAPISFDKPTRGVVEDGQRGRELPHTDFIDELSDPGRPAPGPTPRPPSQRFGSADMPAPAVIVPAAQAARLPSQRFGSADMPAPEVVVSAAATPRPPSQRFGPVDGPAPEKRTPSQRLRSETAASPLMAQAVDPFAGLPEAPQASRSPSQRVAIEPVSSSSPLMAQATDPFAGLAVASPPADSPHRYAASISAPPVAAPFEEEPDPFALEAYAGMPTGVFIMGNGTPLTSQGTFAAATSLPLSTPSLSLSGPPTANDQQVLDDLERKYWALMRVLLRKGHVTRDGFVVELGES